MRQSVVAAVVIGASNLLAGCVVASTGGGSGSTAGFMLFLMVPLVFFYVVTRSLRGAARRSGTIATGGADRRPIAGDVVDPHMIRAELSVLADDVLRLESDVALNEAARNDYESAVHRYRVAHAAMEQSTTDSQVDLTRVQRVVDEARWSMARAKSIVQGHPPPAPPAELRRPGSSGEPAVRVAEDDRPEYVGAPMSFRSGWFGGGGGLLGGLMLGSMLGGFGGWITTDDGADQWDAGGDEPSDW
jgi:hypothetical protein